MKRRESEKERLRNMDFVSWKRRRKYSSFISLLDWKL
jgi:hypothetical protein